MKIRIASVVLAALLGAACSGGSDVPAPAAEPSANSSSGSASSGGPNLALARERLLVNANLITPDAARLVSFTETQRNVDGPSVVVSYEAELEFTADTYFHTEQKAGDHAKVFGEAEYFNEGGDWTLVAMGIYSR